MTDLECFPGIHDISRPCKCGHRRTVPQREPAIYGRAHPTPHCQDLRFFKEAMWLPWSALATGSSIRLGSTNNYGAGGRSARLNEDRDRRHAADRESRVQHGAQVGDLMSSEGCLLSGAAEPATLIIAVFARATALLRDTGRRSPPIPGSHRFNGRARDLGRAQHPGPCRDRTVRDAAVPNRRPRSRRLAPISDSAARKPLLRSPLDVRPVRTGQSQRRRPSRRRPVHLIGRCTAAIGA